jgi:BirA family transcriptional regulator, biotin operon repressor / biotin---[acetyl-CoA-carboxylase] ligase
LPKPTEFEPAMRRALGPVAADVRLFASCGSTNDEAMAWGRAGASHLCVVAADHQTAGRGRRGRTWIAPAGEALLASIIIRPGLPVEGWGVLPLLAGVVIRDAVEARTGVAARLKWPNDLLVNGRKLAGILTEADPPHFAVIGIGMNCSTREFPAELAATSLSLEGAKRLDRADLLAAIVSHMDGVLSDPGAGLQRWREASATLGSEVRITHADGSIIEGRAVQVSESGALIVEAEQGPVTLVSGDVEHLRT